MRILQTVSLTLFTLALVSIAGCGDNSRGYEVITDMKYSVPYDAFAPNPLTPDGKTSLSPVEGTIPHGFTPYPYPKTPEGRAQAERELANPLPHTPEVLARGENRYDIFCAVCHGKSGNGDGPVSGKFPPPQSFASDYMSALSEGRIYHAITRGSMLMPSYASQISPEDRWAIVRYVHTHLQKGKTP